SKLRTVNAIIAKSGPPVAKLTKTTPLLYVHTTMPMFTTANGRFEKSMASRTFSQPYGSTRTNHCYATYTGTFSKISVTVYALGHGAPRTKVFIFCSSLQTHLRCKYATAPRLYAHYYAHSGISSRFEGTHD